MDRQIKAKLDKKTEFRALRTHGFLLLNFVNTELVAKDISIVSTATLDLKTLFFYHPSILERLKQNVKCCTSNVMGAAAAGGGVVY